MAATHLNSGTEVLDAQVGCRGGSEVRLHIRHFSTRHQRIPLVSHLHTTS
jgi:hypothetical protein